MRIATFVIIIVSILGGLPNLFDFTYDVFDGWAYTYGNWERRRKCISRLTFVVSLIGPNFYFNLYFWTRVFVFILIPSCLLALLNALLISGLRKAQKRKDLLLRSEFFRFLKNFCLLGKNAPVKPKDKRTAIRRV